MNVLFISSGRNGRAGDVVKNQGDSLQTAGINIDYFLINPGMFGYLSAIFGIRKKTHTGKYDLVHAHYGLSAISASLAGSFPLVVSLMGSDAFIPVLKPIYRFLSRMRWKATIVKTMEMKRLLKMPEARVIPNGVDLSRFYPFSRTSAREHIKYPTERKLIVFLSSSVRAEKNFHLAKVAVDGLCDPKVDLLEVSTASNSLVPYYLNAANLLLLTSLREGSVNVVKEAMACNCPVVSTNVGDAAWVMGNTEGCFLTTFDKEDVIDKIRKALEFNQKTNGRDRLIQLKLDSASVAEHLTHIYSRSLTENNGITCK